MRENIKTKHERSYELYFYVASLFTINFLIVSQLLKKSIICETCSEPVNVVKYVSEHTREAIDSTPL